MKKIIIGAALVGSALSTNVAMAQVVPRTTGDSLQTAEFNPVDDNGVNLLTGRLTLRSPGLSMGAADNPTEFYLTWVGQMWITNAPHLWIDKDEDWNVTVDYAGGSYEFENMQRGTQDTSVGWHYTYTLKRPGTVGSLNCWFTGSASGGDGWASTCFFSATDVSIAFYGYLPSAGGYPLEAEYDNELFGNAMMWPGEIYTPTGSKVRYKTNGPVLAVASDGGAYTADYPNGIYVSSSGRSDDRVKTFTMKNRATGNITRALTITTPSLNGSDYEDSYLRPKSTTQTFTDPLGRITRYTFNSSGNLVTVTSPEGVVSTFTYDGDHRVKTATRDGATWSYSYNFSDDSEGAGTTTRTDPSGYTYKVSHTKKPGPVTSVVDEWGKTISYAYDGYERLTRVTHPDLSYETYGYDTKSHLTSISEVAIPGSGDPTYTRTAEYPAAGTCTGAVCNQPSQIIDARGHATDFERDAATGLPTKITAPGDAAGRRAETRITYDHLGYWYPSGSSFAQKTDRLLPVVLTISTCGESANCFGTADELITEYSYAPAAGVAVNNLLPAHKVVHDGDPWQSRVYHEENYKYDAIGNVLMVENVDRGYGVDAINIYDNARQKVGEISADPDGTGALPPIATRITYNDDGQVTLVETGTAADRSASHLNLMTVSSRTATAYDYGRPIKVASAGADGVVKAIKETSYDSFGRVRCEAVRMNSAQFPTLLSSGAISGGSLPASPCIAQTSGAQGADRITRISYNRAGELERIEKGVGTLLLQDYVEYGFDAFGKRISVTDANGNKAKYEYDGHHRLRRWYFPSSTTIGQVNLADYEAYTYDANGNRVSLRKRDGSTITYAYDNLNRMSVKAGAATDVAYTYDLRGHQRTAKFVGTGLGVTNQYDGLGRLLSTTTNQSGTALTISHQYDVDGNRTRTTWPDGQYVTYEYDLLDRMKAVKQSGSTVIASMTYNAKGELASETRGAVTTTYGHDAISRLTSLADNLSGTANDVTTTFTYNPASQLASKMRTNSVYAFPSYHDANRTYAVNGLNQYTSAGAVAFDYDDNGNLIVDGTNSYAYDAENRLLNMKQGTTVLAALAYDPLGRLYQTSGSGATTTRYLYDGDELVAEYNTAGALLRRYVHGAGNDDPLIWYEGAGLTNRRSLQTDHQGSIVSIANASGSALHLNTYDEYGVPETNSSGDVLNWGTFQFTGQAWIKPLAMYYYKARIYSPTLGRFLQTDPVGYEDQINLYAYVANDPVNATDPSGERISVVIHEVAFGQYHTKIVIVPDDQKAFSKDSRFQSDENGVLFMTIGGGPDTKLNIFGPLVGDINRPNDVAKTLSGESLETAQILPGKGDTENNLINRMVGVAESYKDDKPYSLFPSAGGDDYNSNSFAYGVLGAVGAKNVPIPEGYSLPGADKPLPPENFCIPGVAGCAQ